MLKYLFSLAFLCFLHIALIAQSVEINNDFFNKADAFFGQYVEDGKVDYLSLKKDPSQLLELMKVVDNASLKGISRPNSLSFYINAYNLTVIKGIVLNYPVRNMEEISGFFDQEKHKITGEYMTLNYLENEIIRPTFKDPRIHFALVCGAIGCPPIIEQAYKPNTLETQLDEQAKIALNNPEFVKVDAANNTVALSKIFEWYTQDFGKKEKDLIPYINNYRTQPISQDSKISYYPYDWTLNDSNKPSSGNGKTNKTDNSIGSDSNPDIVVTNRFTSALLARGKYDINIFTGNYHQKGRNDSMFVNSQTFMTTSAQFMTGLNPKLNIGLDVRIRSVVASDSLPVSRFESFKFQGIEANHGLKGYTRSGISAIGIRLKHLPFKKVRNISVQHTLYFPTGLDLDGNFDFQDNRGYIDWNGLALFNQFFYDQPLTSKASLFVEFDVIMQNGFFDQTYAEDGESFALNGRDSGGFAGMVLSTPATIIISYFPNDKLTFYSLFNAAPQWFGFGPAYPFSQYGLATKYQVNRNLQFELLYTQFFNAAFQGTASTLNFGIRLTN